MQRVLHVPGMGCESCLEKIHTALADVPGVTLERADLKKRWLTVRVDGPGHEAELARTLAGAGYPAIPVAAELLTPGPDPLARAEEATPGELYGAEPHAEVPLDPEATPAELYGGPLPVDELPEAVSPASIYGGEPPALALAPDAVDEDWAAADDMGRAGQQGSGGAGFRGTSAA